MNALLALLKRDVRIAVRVGGGALMGALFFLILVVMMPFAIGPDLKLLARIGPAILWLGALLASLLALDRLFATDYEDGSLDLLMTGRLPLEVTVTVKAVAHWLTTCLPLVIIAPVLGLLLNIELRAMGGGGADAARRHAGAHLHRPDRGGAVGHLAPRRPAACGSGAAADRAGADFRRRRRQCGLDGGRGIWPTFHHPLCVILGCAGPRPRRCGRRLEARAGVRE